MVIRRNDTEVCVKFKIDFDLFENASKPCQADTVLVVGGERRARFESAQWKY